MLWLVLANLIFLPIFLIVCYYALTKRKFCMKKEGSSVNGYDERYFLGLIKISQTKYPNLKDVAYREYLHTFEDEDNETRTVTMHEISLPYDGGKRDLLAMGDKQKTDNLRNYYQRALFDTFSSGKTHYLNESQSGTVKALIMSFALPITLGLAWGLMLWNFSVFFPERVVKFKPNESETEYSYISKSETAMSITDYPNDFPRQIKLNTTCKPRKIIRESEQSKIIGTTS